MGLLEELAKSLQTYYGMDWMCLLFGLVGTHFITQKNSIGFVFSLVGCIFGFCVAYTSQQYGFVVYNILLISMMARAIHREGYIKLALSRVPSLYRVASAVPVSLALLLPVMI